MEKTKQEQKEIGWNKLKLWFSQQNPSQKRKYYDQSEKRQHSDNRQEIQDRMTWESFGHCA